MLILSDSLKLICIIPRILPQLPKPSIYADPKELD